MNEGWINFSTNVNPVSTLALTNTITAKNTIKAWVAFTVNSTGSTFSTSVIDGFNVASVVRNSSSNIAITFANSGVTNVAGFASGWIVASVGGLIYPAAFVPIASGLQTVVGVEFLSVSGAGHVALDIDTLTGSGTVYLTILGS
jgi:hypothetical protein